MANGDDDLIQAAADVEVNLTPYSRRDLCHQALRELGVLPAGQPVPPEAYDAVNRHVDGMVEELRDRDIVWVDSAEQIPRRFFIPLAMILAARAASAFSHGEEHMYYAKAAKAEGVLQAMTQAGPNFEQARVDYL